MTRLTGDEKHDSSSLSTLDVLWVLYDRVLEDDDRFLLSKGHGPTAYYAVLAAKGVIPLELLDGFGTFDSPLGHHPDRMLVPGRRDRRAARSATDSRSPSAVALAGRARLRARRRRGARRGLELGSRAVRRPRRPRRPHGRRDRQRRRRRTAGPAGSSALRARGLARRARRRAGPRGARSGLRDQVARQPALHRGGGRGDEDARALLRARDRGALETTSASPSCSPTSAPARSPTIRAGSTSASASS